MARRRTSVFADLIEMIAAMPWWVGVLLAAGSYWGFHWVALREVPRPKGPHDYSGLAESVVEGMASGLQYLVPAAFLAGAAVSAVTRYRRRKLPAEAPVAERASTLADMTWEQFKVLLAEGFKLKGYIVKPQAADARFDFELIRKAERVLVHCRHWRAAEVPLQALRELQGVMAARAATKGIVVTSGQFTEEARDFARGGNLDLVDGPRLFGMFDDVRNAQTVPERDSAALRLAEPTCPKCGAKMVKRVVKQGPKRGQPFWECSTYPACQGARPIGGT